MNEATSSARLPSVNVDNGQAASKPINRVPEATTESDLLDQMLKRADMMAKHDFLPPHLRNNTHPDHQKANCFRIVAQARSWGLDPYDVMDNCYLVGGKLMYSGVILAAVVNKSGVLAGPLTFDMVGTGDDLTITVKGTRKGSTVPLVKKLRAGDQKQLTKTGELRYISEMWRTDAVNKLYYSTCRAWVKLHCPELLFGFADDDVVEQTEPRDVPNMPAGFLPQAALNAKIEELKEKDAATTLLPAEAQRIKQLAIDADLVYRTFREDLLRRFGAADVDHLTVDQADIVTKELLARTAGLKQPSPGKDAVTTSTPAAPPVVTPAPGEGQTLQEAMAADLVANKKVEAAVNPNAFVDAKQLARLAEVREAYFLVQGFTDSPIDKKTKAASWEVIMGKRGVKHDRDLTVAQADIIIGNLQRQVDKFTAEAQDAAQAARGNPKSTAG